MQPTKLLATAAFAFGLAASALAQTNVYIAGAPALRQSLTTAIEALVDAGGGSPVRAWNGSNLVTANVVSWRNANVAGNSVNIYLTYNGSAGGYQATAGSKPVRFLANSLTGGGQTDVLTNTTATPVQTQIPDFHIANEFQISTPWIGTNNVAFGPGNSTYVNLVDRINGILPLRLVAGRAAPSNLNITPQQIRTLYGEGEIRLSQLTGDFADFEKKVYVLSRGIDSGIRTLWATNNGFGSTTPIIGYRASTITPPSSPVLGLVITSGGTGYTSTPTVTISGGGGTGASATAVISGGRLVGFTSFSGGSGYTAPPSVSISGGGGKLASVTAVISGGTVTAHEIYPGSNGDPTKFVIGIDFADGNGGYPTFGPLLAALTSNLNLPGGNPGDFYFTVLSDADAQVAFAAGAKEVAWNGNKLGTLGTYGNSGGANTPIPTGSSSPALSNGQYELWGYVRLARRSSLTGVPLAVFNAISNRLRDFDNPVLLKDVNIKRSAPDGGPIEQGQIVLPP